MKVGLLGGSFDPIHYGHLNMADNAIEEYGLDEVWMIPSGHSPNKDEAHMTDALIRFTMTAIAIGVTPGTYGAEESYLSSLGKRYPKLRICGIELSSDDTSYTYRTLEKLTTLYPEEDFSFLMGADSLDYFDQWVHPERICQLASILVVNRDHFTRQELMSRIQQIQCLFPSDIQCLNCDKYDVSSHEIREKICKGEDVSDFLPKEVLNFIAEHQLYLTDDNRSGFKNGITTDS